MPQQRFIAFIPLIVRDVLAPFSHLKFAFFVFHGFRVDGDFVTGGDDARKVAHHILALAVGVRNQDVAPGVYLAAVVEQQAGSEQALIPRGVQNTVDIAQLVTLIFQILTGRQKCAVHGHISAAQKKIIAGRKAAPRVEQGRAHIQNQIGTGAQARVVKFRQGSPHGQISEGLGLGFLRHADVLHIQPHAFALRHAVLEIEFAAGQEHVALGGNGGGLGPSRFGRDADGPAGQQLCLFRLQRIDGNTCLAVFRQAAGTVHAGRHPRVHI